jgi:hypothetical protein
MINIQKYDTFEKINENARLSLWTKLRVVLNSYLNQKYTIPIREWEKIISYSRYGLWIDSFMIWKIYEDSNWKNFFNLEYIYSITGKWAGTELLLTYINKNEIKNIWRSTWSYSFMDILLQ